jgi:hypothetical protein
MTAHRPHPRRVSRRAFLGATATATATATAAGFAALPSAARATGPAAAPAMGRVLEHEWARSFARPGLGTAAGFRWWWPHGLVDPAEVAREVDQVADAGFGVLEVADVTHSLRARGIDIDTETYGWGTPAWVEGVKAALTQAIKRNVRIDLTVGPSWPAAVPTITPDDPAACTELVHGRADVAAGTTYDDVLPEPAVHASAGVNRQELVTVQAHRVTARAGALTTLELGEVNDTFRLRVNGEEVPPCDPLDTIVDLGSPAPAGPQRGRNRGCLDTAQPAPRRHPCGVRRRIEAELRTQRARAAGALRREDRAAVMVSAVKGCHGTYRPSRWPLALGGAART